jgi:hypothetical protein
VVVAPSIVPGLHRIIAGDSRPMAAHPATQVGLDARALLTGAQIAVLRGEAPWHLASRTDCFVEVGPAQKERSVRSSDGPGARPRRADTGHPVPEPAAPTAPSAPRASLPAKVLPLIPMRNVVLLPHVLAPVAVGPPRSLAALRHAADAGSPVALVAWPFGRTPDGRHRHGAVAEEAQRAGKGPDGCS